MKKYDSKLHQQLIDWDKQYVWHPFTAMLDYNRCEPLIIEQGEGSYLIDMEGNRYLDGISSLWVNVHGHCRPELNAALIEQINQIAHSTLLGLANVPSIKLATNTEMYQRMAEDMDLNAGRIVDGTATLEEVGREIYETILAVASGTQTVSEELDLGQDEFIPWQLGAVT